MPVTKRIFRGIQDIKTISGRADKGALPYKAFMRLSVLEMEKFRRGKEKCSALGRVENIDARFRDIEKERAEIMQTLEDRGFGKNPATGRGRPSAAPRSSRGAFSIRY